MSNVIRLLQLDFDDDDILVLRDLLLYGCTHNPYHAKRIVDEIRLLAYSIETYRVGDRTAEVVIRPLFDPPND